MNSKLHIGTVVLGLLAVLEHIALLYFVGSEILIEHYYPSDRPFVPEIDWVIVGTVVVSLMAAVMLFNQMLDEVVVPLDNPIDMTLRWTFAIMLLALPLGILLAVPTFCLAAPLTVMLPFKVGGYLWRQRYSTPRSSTQGCSSAAQ